MINKVRTVVQDKYTVAHKMHAHVVPSLISFSLPYNYIQAG